MKKISIMVVVFFSFASVAFCAEPALKTEPVAPKVKGKFHTISQINQMRPIEGVIEVEGYVVGVSTCPPCPKNAVCAPCMPPYVIISEEKKEKELRQYQMTYKELLVQTNMKEGLALGKKYHLTIAVQPYKTSGS